MTLDRRIPIVEPCFEGNERRYLNECLDSGWISSQGPFVSRFEREFARYSAVTSAVSVCNGTAALHLALAALGIGPGDEVIIPNLTFAATINAVLYCGARPVLVDVDRRTWNIDPNAVEGAISERTRAIIPVHLYGLPAPMADLMDLARRNELLVVEDAAESLGSRVADRPSGTIGDAGVFSFFGNKLITCGEGGMIIFSDPAIDKRARVLRDHGMTPGRRYWHDTVGFNYRMTSIQAAVGVGQLEQLDDFIECKSKNADAYRCHLSNIQGVVLQAQLPNCFNSYWLFSILVDGDQYRDHRDELACRLGLAGIETRPFFHPLHKMPPYLAYGRDLTFPHSEWISRCGLSLPSGVRLGTANIDFICETLRTILANARN